AQARALFDVETIPAGQRWGLFFEIDVRRGGEDAAMLQTVALLALWEWTQGRCWLGASAARGLGWMKLDKVEVLRLPMTADFIDAWPDATLGRQDAWENLRKMGGQRCEGAEELRKLALTPWEKQ